MFCWFNKNSNFGTVEQMFSTFALLLAGVGLPVDTRVDDLDIVSRSQVFQNNKLHLTTTKNRYSSTEFELCIVATYVKRSSTVCFVRLVCILATSSIPFFPLQFLHLNASCLSICSPCIIYKLFIFQIPIVLI